jgi:hypothetical protein
VNCVISTAIDRAHRRHEILLLVNGGNVRTVCFLANDLYRWLGRREAAEGCTVQAAYRDTVGILLPDALSLALALLCRAHIQNQHEVTRERTRSRTYRRGAHP